jgi:hypothetical protein
MRGSALLGAGLAVVFCAVLQAQPNGPLPGPLPLFPPDNWWNVDISSAPVDANSANFITYIGPEDGMHPDFGAEDTFPLIYGMVHLSVPGTQPLVPVEFVEFGNQSDAGAPGRPPGYPIPEEAKTQAHWIEGGPAGSVCGGGDRHMLIVDRDNRLLYELYHACWDTGQNRWEAGSGAIFSLDSNDFRPETWTSADASGMAILPGLVRYGEVDPTNANGAPIRHAFRFTVHGVNGHVFPATHNANTGTSAAPPLGARLRLKAATDISGYPAYIQRIFQAMKTYGLIVADTGSDMYIQGDYNTNWDNGELNPAFDDITASDFEVIQLGWHPATTVVATERNFFTLSPCRLIDTRLTPGPTQAGSSGAPALHGKPIYSGFPNHPAWSRVFRVAGHCNVPTTAKAVSLNVTAVTPAVAGFFTFYPGDQLNAPATSTVSFGAGQTRANNLVVALSRSGSGTLAVQNNSTAAVAIVVDVNGYFE